MYFFQPKVIEKETDLLCKLHQQKIAYVNLEPQLFSNQRLLCKSCGQQNPSNSQIVDYQQLKQNFDNQQKERIQIYQPIVKPHIEHVESFQKMIDVLKTKLIQQLDYLFWVSKTGLIDSLIQYSLFGEIDLLIQNQMPIINSKKIIKSIQKINNDFNTKINPKLEQFKLLPPEMLGNICKSKKYNSQQIEVNSQSIILPIKQEAQAYEWKEDLFEIIAQSKEIDSSIYTILIRMLIKKRLLIVQDFYRKMRIKSFTNYTSIQK
ncbi:unnamed protein product [Paramecium pentaurelia]|uniref:Uncharacterized protein n=1 Tax=Paramecium pentaurelia TaxID=43138 RepID=A0A8S1UKU9_9CILI|nr:unnamed protein product [Paramecium pentaurelia]